MLKNQLVDIGLLASNEFVLSSIPIRCNFGFGTYHSGALFDAWQTPCKIEPIGQTNFVGHTAGKDKISATRTTSFTMAPGEQADRHYQWKNSRGGVAEFD
jgi:hypothetical protein